MFGLPRIVTVLLLAYLALFTWHSLGVARQFSPDSMNYVDVARHVRAGDGLVQTTIGFNEPRIDPRAEPPVPFVAQAPLYPLVIAWLAEAGALVPAAGLSEEDAALLLPTLFYLVALLAGAALVRNLAGEAAGLFALGLLVVHYPLAEISRYALTDTIGVAFVLVSFALLARSAGAGEAGDSAGDPAGGVKPAMSLVLFASGFTAGLAFATRYALAPFVLVGAGYVATRLRGRARAAVLYVAGAALPVGAVLARNIAATGALAPPKPGPNAVWYESVAQFVVSLVPWLANPERISLFSQAIVIAIIAFLLVRHARRRAAGAGVAGSDVAGSGIAGSGVAGSGLAFPAAGIVTYGAFLVLVSLRVRTTGIDPRLALPAAVLLMLLVAIAFARTARLTPRGAARIASGLLVLAILGSGVRIGRGPTNAFDGCITPERRDQIAWIEANTSPGDRILGENTVDLAFTRTRDRLYSFSEYPFTDRLTRETFDAIASRVTGRDLYVVLRAHDGWTEEDLRWSYGDFVADLIIGEAPAHGLERVHESEGGVIYRFTGQENRTTR